MMTFTTWTTDDQCPDCGTDLTETPGHIDGEMIQECRACGWSVTWAMDEATHSPSVTP
jgi:predicted RNA-binding Zn-ribbon protein involved in translation (DUF1610 family)